jgi:hypothetical protein
MSTSPHRILSLGLAALAVAAIAAPAKASNSIDLYYTYWQGANWAPESWGDAGAFTAVIQPGSTLSQASVIANYSPVSLFTEPDNTTAFETFCVETQVDFSPPGPYSFSTGLTTQQSPAFGTTGLGYLTAGAAWLYQQFATGQFAVGTPDAALIDPSNNIYNNSNDAGAIQNAIWELLGEDPSVTNSGYGAPSQTTAVYNLALAHFGNSLTNAEAQVTSASEYGVQVIELYSGSNPSSYAQDQLIYTGTPTPPHYITVPDSGTTVALLGMALLPLVFFRRRSVFQS